MDLSKYVELFLAEGREHIAEMYAALLVLERGEDNADARTSAVAAMFRAVHTIKGMAAAMQYADVVERSHALETGLDDVRQGRATVTPALVTYLYDETDALAHAIETAVGQGAVPSGNPVSEATANITQDTKQGVKQSVKQSAKQGTKQSVTQSVAQDTVPRATRAATASRYVRVDATRLDALLDLAGELELARVGVERLVAGDDPDALRDAVGHLSRLVSDMRGQVMTVRMIPVGHVFERFPRLVRDTARALHKDVEFVIDGGDIELDRSTLDVLGDPVLHLLRNAIDHGIETPAERTAAGKAPRGRLTLSAQRETNYVIIRVADDGRGIDRDTVLARARRAGLVAEQSTSLDDHELLHVLTSPGFSTAETVTDVSGRGVGLDVVDAAVHTLGGTLDVRSVAGRGTVLTLRLPLTVSVIRALLARLGNETIAIPVTNVIETVELDPSAFREAEGGRMTTTIRDEPVAVVPLRTAVGLPPRRVRTPQAVTVDVRGRRAALVVDTFVGQQDVVVKRFDSADGAADLFSGATILNDGAPALIVDVNRLVSLGSAEY
jgi:two-component system chemotaxis sensor kinase CheA